VFVSLYHLKKKIIYDTLDYYLDWQKKKINPDPLDYYLDWQKKKMNPELVWTELCLFHFII